MEHDLCTGFEIIEVKVPIIFFLNNGGTLEVHCSIIPCTALYPKKVRLTPCAGKMERDVLYESVRERRFRVLLYSAQLLNNELKRRIASTSISIHVYPYLPLS